MSSPDVQLQNPNQVFLLPKTADEAASGSAQKAFGKGGKAQKGSEKGKAGSQSTGSHYKPVKKADAAETAEYTGKYAKAGVTQPKPKQQPTPPGKTPTPPAQPPPKRAKVEKPEVVADDAANAADEAIEVEDDSWQNWKHYDKEDPAWKQWINVDSGNKTGWMNKCIPLIYHVLNNEPEAADIAELYGNHNPIAPLLDSYRNYLKK
jgi:hypothetical protein